MVRILRDVARWGAVVAWALVPLAGACSYIQPETKQQYYYGYSQLNAEARWKPRHISEFPPPLIGAEDSEEPAALAVAEVDSAPTSNEPGVVAEPAAAARPSAALPSGAATAAAAAEASANDRGPSVALAEASAAASEPPGSDTEFAPIVEHGLLLDAGAESTGAATGFAGAPADAELDTLLAGGAMADESEGPTAALDEPLDSADESEAALGGSAVAPILVPPAGSSPAASPAEINEAVAVAAVPTERRASETSALGLGLAEAAEALVGSKLDNSVEGMLASVLSAQGVPTPDLSDSQWLKALYIQQKELGLTYDQETPLPGDLVFFHNTFDRNSDGRNNDWYTHAGIVVRTREDGTVVFVTFAQGEVQEMLMNLERPEVRRDEGKGVALNSYLRAKSMSDPEFTHYLSGELFAGFSSPALP